MRVWDISPQLLCDKHLLGEHAEIHAVWSIITRGKKGYSAHPEVLRWRGKLSSLYERHELVVSEMIDRGFSHTSPLDKREATGKAIQDEFIDSPARQLRILSEKGCACAVRAARRSEREMPGHCA